jgi:hypothetical protein
MVKGVPIIMPKLSQDAIRELRQSLPLLERLLKTLTKYSDKGVHPPLDETWLLGNAYHRLSELTSPAAVLAWVGAELTYYEDPDQYKAAVDAGKVPKVFEITTPPEQARLTRGYAERLYMYVQGILQNEEIEEMLNRLTQENTNLKEQVTELRRRESTYLAIIKEAQTSATYSLPPKNKGILLDSLQRQHTTLTKNLCRLQEIKAQYGLNTPLDILNAIDQTQEDLNRIEVSVADLEDSTT